MNNPGSSSSSSRSHHYRPINLRYKNRNGFDEYNKQFPTEELAEGEAIEKQDFARFVIREMGSFFPSIEDMKREVESAETYDSISERIKRLKSEHAQQISKLSRYYAQQVRDDALDRYMQADELKYQTVVGQSASGSANDKGSTYYSNLESFFKQNEQKMLRSHNDIVARTQYEYLRELTELNSRLRRFPGTKQGPQFPSTIEAYHKLSGNKGTLLEVARYLMADEGKRTQMRDVYKWPSQQTEPLIEEYNKNEGFRAEVKRLVNEYRGVKDPRKRTLPG
ncbi:hypothetical protein PNOK_0492200 [Pyrrhoderma noxium]|uniref:Uncharacterized protein n=1 Tax=Pyrrhoderma noxium TaxID=2282107 RepID=A0A286UK94_9AGAM|nr:hypothetical protein PNOK_0492200 [Pyrrhoderma noxium]